MNYPFIAFKKSAFFLLETSRVAWLLISTCPSSPFTYLSTALQIIIYPWWISNRCNFYCDWHLPGSCRKEEYKTEVFCRRVKDFRFLRGFVAYRLLHCNKFDLLGDQTSDSQLSQIQKMRLFPTFETASLYNIILLNHQLPYLYLPAI